MEEIIDYLDELDSVRNSDAEVIWGQNELLDRLFYTDHTVALTMQQLTDGRVFGNLLRDAECTEYILFQFSIGRLRYSQYGTIKTPSQYVQGSLEKCKKRGYIFSYLPIKQEDGELLEAELNALKNGTIEYLEELKKKRPNEIEQMEFLENYTKLIFYLCSRDPAKITPKPKEECRSLTDFLEVVLNDDSNIKDPEADKKNRAGKADYDTAKQILFKIREELKGKDGEQNRTEWYNCIHDKAAKESGNHWRSYWLAEALVDIAYNLTLADSINGCVVPKGEELEQEIQSKLIKYWRYERTPYNNITDAPAHEFLKQDNNAVYNWKPEYDEIKARWKVLKSLTEDMEKFEKKKKSNKSWTKRLRSLSAKLFFNCIWAILIFGIVELLASIDYIGLCKAPGSILQKVCELYKAGEIGFQIRNCIISIFIISSLFTVLSNWLKVQDFIDSLKKLGRSGKYICFSLKALKYNKKRRDLYEK